jgi:hypothetical protein
MDVLGDEDALGPNLLEVLEGEASAGGIRSESPKAIGYLLRRGIERAD